MNWHYQQTIEEHHIVNPGLFLFMKDIGSGQEKHSARNIKNIRCQYQCICERDSDRWSKRNNVYQHPEEHTQAKNAKMQVLPS